MSDAKSVLEGAAYALRSFAEALETDENLAEQSPRFWAGVQHAAELARLRAEHLERQPPR